MPERWVVNASPIIALGAIGRLGLLAELAAEVVVPPAVAAEVRRGADAASRAIEHCASFRFPAVVASLPTVVMWGLGRGKTEVISVAMGEGGTKRCSTTSPLAAVPPRSTSRAVERWASCYWQDNVG